jgi:hypothetical protein
MYAHRRKGKLHTRLSFHIETTKSGAFNLGMGKFNASSARFLGMSPIASSFVGLEFQDFLADPRVAVEITPTPEDTVPCTLGVSKNIRQTCNQVFYMPGTYGDFDVLQNASLPHADLVVVHDMRGYQLDFNTPKKNTNIVYDLKKDCDVYGTNMIAFQICFQDLEDTIAMRKWRPSRYSIHSSLLTSLLGLNTCLNSTDMSNSACLSDNTWRQQPGTSSTLKMNVRTGTVGFSRLNSTIQTHMLTGDVQPANIVSAQLLEAFHGLFTGRSRATASHDLTPGFTDFLDDILGGFTSQVNMAPVIVAVHFASGPLFYGTQHTGKTRNAMSLHSLIAKVLYWCSIPIAQTLSAIETGVGTENLTSTLQTGFDDGGQATYSLATSTYELVVG